MRRRILLALALVPFAAVVGCGAAPHDAASPERASAADCASIDAVLDVVAALRFSAAGAEGATARIVDLDEEIGYVQLARERLAAGSSPRAHALGADLQSLERELAARRARAGEATTALAATQEAAERALDEAARCGGVDLRRPDALHADVEDARATKARRAALASKTCEPALRLWSAAENVDLTSAVATSSLAAHVRELSLGGERGAVRDRLARALAKHGAALGQLEAEARANDLAAVRAGVLERAEALGNACLAAMPASERVLGGRAEPRAVTVTVRPRWSGPLAALPHPIEFGSGFVVRWRDDAGHVEARIVTNAHVMDGAFEADVVPSDGEASVATLIAADDHEDVAVLRVGKAPRGAFARGVALRLAPAREDEPVIAAGFPGVGARPSFQVSRGIVSNARFGEANDDAGPGGSFVQHTAPIDPGNSGGPLLDQSGYLVGMNTMKIVGRENVGLAIPAARVQLALLRADRTRVLAPAHAAAACNAAVAALASPSPDGRAMDRFGIALYEQAESRPPIANAATYADAVRVSDANPVALARVRAYAAVRAQVERERGVRPFETCSPPQARADGTFTATFRSRTAEHRVVIAPEHGVMRAVAFE